MNKIFVFIVLVNSVSMPQGANIKFKGLQENVFHQVHMQIHDTVNDIFRLLGLNANFTKNYKNNILLSMHNSMKTLAEEIFLEHQNIKAVAYLKDIKKPKEGLFNLENTVEMVIDETFKPITCKASNNRSKISGLITTLTSLEIPDNSEESIAFLKEYLYKVKASEIYGFDSPAHKIKQFYESHKLQAKKDIKTWYAPISTEDLNKTLTRRIFNGTNVRVNMFPFMASLHVMGDFSCAASIIKKEWVITAAVCLHIAFKNQNFVKQNPSAITIRIGSDYTVRFGQQCAISNIIFHPDYDPETLGNNLALLKFRCKMHYRKKKKINKIVYKSLVPGNIQTILLLGWGSKDSQVSYGHDPLSSSFLDIYDIERCKKIYSSKFVSNSNFCAGFKNRGSGACQRDAGGPGIVNSVLMGVVSFGAPVCGAPDAPTVFTNIDLYTDWIDTVVKEKPFIKTNETTVATIIATKANIEKLNLKLKHQKKKHLTGVTIPKAQYPKVMRVVSELLNKLIVGQDIESIAYEDSKAVSDSDESDDMVIVNNGKYPDDKAIFTDPKKITTQITKADVLKNNIDKYSKPKSQFTQTQKLESNIDPYFSSAKKMQGRLGFDNLINPVQAQSINVTNYMKSNGSANTLQSATSNELAIESTDLSDNYVDGSGLSIEVSSGMTAELTVTSDEENQDLAKFSSTRILNPYLDDKHSTILIEDINDKKLRKGSKTTADKVRVIQPNVDTSTIYTSRIVTRPLQKTVLYTKSKAELRNIKSEEKINITLSKTKLTDEYASDIDNDDLKKYIEMSLNKAVPNDINNMHDASESMENTNELLALVEQIRNELSSNKSKLTMATDDNIMMGTEEQFESRYNKTDLPIHTDNNYETSHAFNERPRLLKMGDTVRNIKFNIAPYNSEAEIAKKHHKRKNQLNFVEDNHRIINGELHAARKSIQNDELSQAEGEEVGGQLLDYINV